MKPLIFLIACCSILTSASAQYKNDNVLFHTINPAELCKALSASKDYLLLDVRSPGEYADTSASTGLNLGHLKGARNIDIRHAASRLNEIADYRNKPVFVYCSHSQRSRWVSKMLADSGFTNVNNINGGLTGIYLLSETERSCLMNMITTANHYAVLSPADVCQAMSKGGNKVLLLDVRPDSAWQRVSSSPRINATGYFKGSMHIALTKLPDRISSLPHDGQIIITDIFGGDAAAAARLLESKGFTNIGFLMEGMDRWLSSDREGLSCLPGQYISPVNWMVMSVPEFSRFLPKNKSAILLDVRPDIQYENRDSNTYKNIGHLKNALHIPLASLENNASSLGKDLSVPVVIYEFSGGPDAYTAANMLAARGFKNVYVLAGGIFNLRWSAANMPGMAFLKDWVEGVGEGNE